MLPRHVDDPFHLYIRKDGYNYSTVTANNARKYEGLEVVSLTATWYHLTNGRNA